VQRHHKQRDCVQALIRRCTASAQADTLSFADELGIAVTESKFKLQPIPPDYGMLAEILRLPFLIGTPTARKGLLLVLPMMT
jgi:hypothetical protein